MLAMQFQLERSQWWGNERLHEEQARQLRSLLAHASSRVPRYRGLAASPEDLKRWPVVRKADLVGNEGAFRASGYPKEHGGLVESATTGSTGHPVRLAFTEAAQFVTHALVLRHYLWHQFNFEGKLAVINPHLQDAEGANWGVITGAAFLTGPIATLNIGADIARQLDWLLAHRPMYLQTRPSNLRAMIQRSREIGAVPVGLKAITMQSEMLPQELRRLVRDAWNVPLLDTYSCGEFGTLALQCPEHEHYHVQSESVHLEVLRDDGSECAPGEIGRVVVTTLHNFAMPLIRYELGDYAEVGEPCACGRGLPVLERIAGRVRNLARDPNGRTFWPSFHAPLWLEVAPFRQIRLVQQALSRIEVQYVLDRSLSADEMGRVRAALQESLGYPFDVTFSRVDSIRRSPGEKFEDFLSLLEER